MKILEEKSRTVRLSSIKITYHSDVSSLKGRVTWYVKWLSWLQEEEKENQSKMGFCRTQKKLKTKGHLESSKFSGKRLRTSLTTWVRILRGEEWTRLLWDSCSRWCCRKIQNSLSPHNTPQAYSYIWNNFFFPEKTLKTSWATPTHWANERKKKKPHQSWLKSPRHNLAVNPTLSTVTYHQEGAQNPELLPEEQRVWIPHQTPQILRPAPER